MSLLSGKYVSCYTVFERAYRDYGFKDHLDWIDGIEWVGEAIALLGNNKAFYQKVTGQDGGNPTIKIEDYRGELPCDLYKIIQVREYCNKMPMREASDSFHFGSHTDRVPDFDTITDYTYRLNNNYIFTNFEEGELEIAYIAFPIDDKGFPLIPDDEKYIRACKDYVAERIAFKMFIRGELDQVRYNLIAQERAWSMGSAKTRGDMMGLDGMETFKNAILRTIPKINQHSDGFHTLGQQEQRYIY